MRPMLCKFFFFPNVPLFVANFVFIFVYRSALPLFLRSVGAQAQAESKGFSRLKEPLARLCRCGGNF